jgi:Rrf2 family cysteine metabolism transcriptional repressor
VKITYRGDYALKAILELSIRYEDNKTEVIPITEIAKFGDMPKKFLEQILLTLVRGGFLKSKRGAGGGFILARPPENITVGDVIRLIEGPIEPIECVNEGYKGCADVKCCILRNVWQEVAVAISEVVDTLNFKELVERYKKRNVGKSFEYVI